MTTKRQSKNAIKSISLRISAGDLATLKKAAVVDRRSVQKYAAFHLLECAKKTLQQTLPLES